MLSRHSLLMRAAAGPSAGVARNRGGPPWRGSIQAATLDGPHDQYVCCRTTRVTSTDSMLAGTPYVIPEDAESQRSFAKVLSKNSETSLRAQRVREQIGQEAEELLGPFLFAQRSDLVAESNQMEGYDVSRRQVQDAVRAHEELLDGPVHSLLEVLKADPKIVTALGLYKAQLLADEWAHRADRPMAFELRQLHALIVVDDHIGGRFRTFDVGIGGTTFRPATSLRC